MDHLSKLSSRLDCTVTRTASFGIMDQFALRAKIREKGIYEDEIGAVGIYIEAKLSIYIYKYYIYQMFCCT